MTQDTLMSLLYLTSICLPHSLCGLIYISQHYLVQHFLSYFESKFLHAHLHCVEIEKKFGPDMSLILDDMNFGSLCDTIQSHRFSNRDCEARCPTMG